MEGEAFPHIFWPHLKRSFVVFGNLTWYNIEAFCALVSTERNSVYCIIINYDLHLVSFRCTQITDCLFFNKAISLRMLMLM